MRKRVSRPPRFAAVDNDAIDTIPSVLATGLLTTLIRAKDGDDVTVEGLAREKTEGREALTKAMRVLVEGAYVVKFKIQRDKSEQVTLEDGSTETKRGGSWYTTFTVDSIPFTAEDVADMLGDIYQAGNIKAVRVEPTRLDPRKSASEAPRPTNGYPSVGPTCGNAEVQEPGTRKPQVGPTDGYPTVGRPTVGPSAAHIRKKTSSEDSLSGAAANGVEHGERDAAEPKNNNLTDSPTGVGDTADIDKVMDAYIAAYMTTAGLPPQPDAIGTVRAAAAAQLSIGRSVGYLCERAAELGAKGWADLVKHVQHNPEKPVRTASQSKPWCGECNYGMEPASPGARMREGAKGMEKCHCHPGYVPQQTVHV